MNFADRAIGAALAIFMWSIIALFVGVVIYSFVYVVSCKSGKFLDTGRSLVCMER